MASRNSRNNLFSSGPSRSSRPSRPRGGQYVGKSGSGLSMGNRREARRQSSSTVRNVSSYGGGPSSRRGSSRPASSYPGSSRSSRTGSSQRGGYVHQPVDRSGRNVPPARSSRGASRGTARSASSAGRNSVSGTQSVRLGDIGRQERRQRASALSSSLFKKLLIVVAVLAIFAGAYAGLYYSGLFKVESVTVAGADHLTEEAVVDLADVPKDASMLTVDTNAIRQNVLTNGWVQDVQVNKVLPSTLQLQVTERTIQAVVEVTSKDAESTELWGVSTDGVWLMKIPDKDSEEAAGLSEKVYEDADAVLHVVDVPYGVVPEEGQPCTDDNVNNALSIIGGMTTELADQVKEVSADGAETTTLILDSGVEIAFGSADDIRDKERICLELLKEHEGTIAYINVRVVNRPTWRALG